MKTIEVNLPQYNWKDPDNWAKSTEVYIAWLRVACPQLGLDTKRVITANILTTIIGDDINCFGLSYKPEQTKITQRFLQIRMGTEINAPETPYDIKQQLIRVRGELHRIDWTSPAGYAKAVQTWKAGVLDYVQKQIDTHKEYREMIEDYRADRQILVPQWRKFVYGKA